MARIEKKINAQRNGKLKVAKNETNDYTMTVENVFWASQTDRQSGGKKQQQLLEKLNGATWKTGQ